MARVHLGMSDGEFFRLTPRQFHLLIDQHRERVEHVELLAGIVASTVANWSMNAPKKAFSPSDFMPSKSRRAPRESKRLNRKAIDKKIRAFFEAQIKAQNVR